MRTLASAPSELRNPKGLWRGVLGLQQQSSRTRCLLHGQQGATRWGRGETSQVIIGPPGEGSRWTYFKAEPVGLPGGLEVEGRSKRGIKVTAGTLSCATETGESAQGTGGPRHAKPLHSECHLLLPRLSLWPSPLPPHPPRSQQTCNLSHPLRASALWTPSQVCYPQPVSLVKSEPHHKSSHGHGTVSHPRDCPSHSLH